MKYGYGGKRPDPPARIVPAGTPPERIEAPRSGASRGVANTLKRGLTDADAAAGFSQLLAPELRFIEVAASLPLAAESAEGDVVLLTTDHKLYRFTGVAWTKVVETIDLSGQITETQIADDSISTPKLKALSVTAAELAANSVIAGKISTNAVVAGTIAAGAVGAAEIAAGSISADKLAVLELSAIAADVGTLTAGLLRNAVGTRFIDLEAAGSAAWIKSDSFELRADGVAIFGGDRHPQNLLGEDAGPEQSGTSGGWAHVYLGTWSLADLGVEVGDKLSFGADVKVVGARTISLRFEFYDATFTLISAFNGPQEASTSYIHTALENIEIPGGTATVTVGLDNNPFGNDTDLGFGKRAMVVRGPVAPPFAEPPFRLARDTGVTTTHISDSAITTAKVAAGAISAAKIAAGTITANEIAAGAIATAELAAGAVTASKIAANTITAGEIAAGAITASELAANSVTAGSIQAGAVQTAALAAGSVTAAKIAANTITASQIASNTITATQIAASAITASELAADAVTAGAISANAITASHISAGAIDTAALAAGAVTAAKIAAGTITASEIAANTITAAQIAAGAISASELAANAVTAGSIQANAVTAAKISVGTLSAISANLGTVTAGTVQANVVIAAERLTAAIVQVANEVNVHTTLAQGTRLKKWFIGFYKDVDLSAQPVYRGTIEYDSTSNEVRLRDENGGKWMRDDGSANRAQVAAVVVSASPPSGDYPEGTIWIET